LAADHEPGGDGIISRQSWEFWRRKVRKGAAQNEGVHGVRPPHHIKFPGAEKGRKGHKADPMSSAPELPWGARKAGGDPDFISISRSAGWRGSVHALFPLGGCDKHKRTTQSMATE